jgi:hypothetical protein
MATYKLISSYEATGSVASITFSSIPQTYTDLVILHSVRTTRTDGMADLITEINADGSGITKKTMYADGTPSNTSGAGGNMPGNSNKHATGIFGNHKLYFPNYTRTAHYKNWVSDGVVENNIDGDERSKTFQSTQWANNNAITQIRIYDSTGNNFIQYSTAYLYGISNA